MAAALLTPWINSFWLMLLLLLTAPTPLHNIVDVFVGTSLVVTMLPISDWLLIKWCPETVSIAVLILLAGNQSQSNEPD